MIRLIFLVLGFCKVNLKIDNIEETALTSEGFKIAVFNPHLLSAIFFIAQA